MKKSNKNEVFSVSISKDHKKKLKKLCATHNRGQSNMFEKLIDDETNSPRISRAN